MGVVSRNLSILFSSLGDVIGRHPKKFIFFPLAITVILGYGITYFEYIDDVNYLYTVTNSENKMAKKLVETYFPEKSDSFDPSRAMNYGHFLRIIVMREDEGSILTDAVWKELVEVNSLVTGVVVENQNFSGLCYQWQNECQNLNSFLEMESLMPEIENGSLRLSYPIMFNAKSFNSYPIALFMGGIELTQDSYSVKSAKAIILTYLPKTASEEENRRGKNWEEKVLQALDRADAGWKHIKVYRITQFSFSHELLQNIYTALPAFLISVTLATIFAIFSSMMSDCVKSKPLLGIFGVLSALLATIAAFGILCYLGFPIIVISISVPFILLGIGLDDTFVLVAAWRRTNSTDSVSKRLSETYSEAAVSITITSLTDMLSFFVGIFTPIPSVQVYCLYAGTGVLFIYLYQVFFFGGIMAIFGNLEAKNRHSLFWWVQAIPKSKAENMGYWKRTFMTGGFDESDPKNILNNSDNSAMVFFRDGFSTFICNKYVKAAFMLIFFGYVCASCLGITKINEGTRFEQLVRFDSELAKFIEKEDMYFKAYPYRIQVVITKPLDYSSNETQSRINQMFDDIYKLESMTSEFSENWLRDYTRYVSSYQDLYDLNITNENEFNDFFREEYISDRMPTSLDVKFNEDNSTIIATRYIVQTKNVLTNEQAKWMLVDLRKVANDYQDLNVTIFQNLLDFVDQFIVIRELTIKMVTVAAIVVMVVTVLFIPNLATSLAVFFSIVFIELGVLGGMGYWNVNLDLAAVVCLIACIGFSVDFSAHISYAHISSEAPTSTERIRESMYSLGLPIMQSGISTLIGALGIIYVPVESYHVFLKIIALVIVFATFHGLLVLPIIFSIFKPEDDIYIACSPKQKKYSLKVKY